MKAVDFTSHGGPEVLRYEDAPDPVPAPGRAIVRVRACALNHLDLWQRRGLERVRIPLPHISGATSPARSSIGRRHDRRRDARTAAARTELRHVSRCARPAATIYCPNYDVLGYMSDGGYAELVSVPVENLVPIPDHDRFPVAAAFPLTFLTAWHMLITRAGFDARRHRARPRGRQRRRARPPFRSRGTTARASSRRRHRRSCSRRASSAPKRCSTTTPVISPRSCGLAPTAAAPTSSSSTSARRPGSAASAHWPAAAGS